MSQISDVTPEKQPKKIQDSILELSDEVYQMRKKILNEIIDQSVSLVDIQSSTNRLFLARTCPFAALNLEEATLYQSSRH
jgi:hypothetical protein